MPFYDLYRSRRIFIRKITKGNKVHVNIEPTVHSSSLLVENGGKCQDSGRI